MQPYLTASDKRVLSSQRSAAERLAKAIADRKLPLPQDSIAELRNMVEAAPTATGWYNVYRTSRSVEEIRRALSETQRYGRPVALGYQSLYRKLEALGLPRREFIRWRRVLDRARKPLDRMKARKDGLG